MSEHQCRAMRVLDDDGKKKDEVTLGIDQEEEEKKKEMFIAEGFHAHSLITCNDESSSVLTVEMINKEEPSYRFQNVVKKNQEPVDKELDDSFIAEQVKETQEEICCKDSAKEDVFQVHSLPPSMSRYENPLVKMMNSETSNTICIESKQDEVFQLKDVVTGDQHLILVVETAQDDFIKSNSYSPSQNLVELSNGGELSASGSNSKRISEFGSTRIVSGYGCARKETMSSIDLGKKRAGICSENIRQPRRRFTETNSKKDVLSMFVEARNVFGQKKLDGNKQSYSREEMEVLRFVNSYQQRQIWREIYTGLGPVVAKQLNQLSEARQNGKAITDQQQQQQHYHPQPQHPRQHQEHHRYPLQHHQYSQQKQHHQQKKPPQHHHHHNHHQNQLAGVHREDTSILGAGTTLERAIHLLMNLKNARTKGTTLCIIRYNEGVLLGTDGCLYSHRTPENAIKHAATDKLPSNAYYESLLSEFKSEYGWNNELEFPMQHGILTREKFVKKSDIREKMISFNDPGKEVICAYCGNIFIAEQVVIELLLLTKVVTIKDCIDVCQGMYAKQGGEDTASFYFASHEEGHFKMVHVSKKDGVRDIPKHEVISAGSIFGNMVLSKHYRENMSKAEATELAAIALRASSIARCSGGKLQFISLDLNGSEVESPHFLWPVCEDDRAEELLEEELRRLEFDEEKQDVKTLLLVS